MARRFIPPPPPEDRIRGARAAGDYAGGVSRYTIYDWSGRGLISVWRFAGWNYYSKRELDSLWSVRPATQIVERDLDLDDDADLLDGRDLRQDSA